MSARVVVGGPGRGAREAADAQMRTFFREAIESAVSNQALSAASQTIHYVAEVLTFFARSRNFFEHTPEGLGLRPLAEYYGQAVYGETVQIRAQALQRLGDVALFVSGLLADSLNRKLVDVDYYIAMGGSAYGQLADQRIGVPRVPSDVFSELAEKFARFVDVLDEVAENAPGRHNASLLRSYELWVRTGSPRAARRLRRQGVLPAPGSVSRRHH